MSKTTWMTSPDDGEDYAASTPADVARLRALGYTESSGGGSSQQSRSASSSRPTEGVEKPAPDKS